MTRAAWGLRRVVLSVFACVLAFVLGCDAGSVQTAKPSPQEPAASVGRRSPSAPWPDRTKCWAGLGLPADEGRNSFATDGLTLSVGTNTVFIQLDLERSTSARDVELMERFLLNVLPEWDGLRDTLGRFLVLMADKAGEGVCTTTVPFNEFWIALQYFKPFYTVRIERNRRPSALALQAAP